MGSATGSQSYIAMIKQSPTAPRTLPVTPVLQKVNFSSDDLTTNIETKTSDHIRDDRMTSDLARTGLSIEGGYEFEYQFENSLADELLLAFLWCEAWVTNVAKNGKFYQPFYIERGHSDVSQYFQYLGMAANVMTLEFPDQDMVKGSYSFVGLASDLVQAPITGATYTNPTQNEIFSTVFSVPTISIDGVALGSCLVKEMTIEINNNVTPKTGIGVLGACETIPHRFEITGELTMYFEDEVMYKKFKDGTAFSIGWTLQDEAGNSYQYLLPRVKLNADEIPVEGVDDEVMENAGFTALFDETENCMIKITRVKAP